VAVVCAADTAAGLTTTFVEAAVGVRFPLENCSVIVVATLCARVAKVATPLEAVAVTVPCSVPVPPSRVAVTIVLLSAVRTLPKASKTWIAGCCPKATPAVAVADGWVRIASEAAAPALTTTFVDVGVVRPGLP